MQLSFDARLFSRLQISSKYGGLSSIYVLYRVYVQLKTFFKNRYGVYTGSSEHPFAGILTPKT